MTIDIRSFYIDTLEILKLTNIKYYLICELQEKNKQTINNLIMSAKARLK